MRDEAEYVSKISNTIINLVGIIALIIGIAELHHLETREDSADGYWDLDLFLLRFTSFFSFLYMLFTMITGAFNHHIQDFPNELHIINGLCDLLQIILQLCFIQSLKQKVTNFALFLMKNIKKCLITGILQQPRIHNARPPNHDFPLSVQLGPMDRVHL